MNKKRKYKYDSYVDESGELVVYKPFSIVQKIVIILGALDFASFFLVLIFIAAFHVTLSTRVQSFLAVAWFFSILVLAWFMGEVFRD